MSLQSQVDLPIAFASRPLNAAKQNYSVIQTELLTIKWTLNYYRPYLYGREFHVIADYRIWLYNINKPSSRLLRCRLDLDECNFKIIHKAGKLNSNADALSQK